MFTKKEILNTCCNEGSSEDSIHFSEQRDEQEAVSQDQDQGGSRAAYRPLGADQIGENAYEKDANHCDAPFHHIDAHDSSAVFILAVGLQQSVTQGHAPRLAQAHGNERNQGNDKGIGYAEGHETY